MDKSTYTLSEQVVQELRRDHAEQARELARLKQLVLSQRGISEDATNPGAVKRAFYNASGETAPAFAVMAVNDGGKSGLEPYLTITKPSATFRRQYVVNGDLPVPGGSWGYCYERGSVEVLYESGTPAKDEGWGPKPDQWELARFYPETATVVKVSDTATRRMVANWKQITECWGNVTTAVSQGGTGNVALYAGTFGSETSIGITLSGVGNPSTDLTLHDKVNIGWMNGQPEMYPREC
jgi:hypothetical protein